MALNDVNRNKASIHAIPPMASMQRSQNLGHGPMDTQRNSHPVSVAQRGSDTQYVPSIDSKRTLCF